MAWLCIRKMSQMRQIYQKCDISCGLTLNQKFKNGVLLFVFKSKAAASLPPINPPDRAGLHGRSLAFCT